MSFGALDYPAKRSRAPQISHAGRKQPEEVDDDETAFRIHSVASPNIVMSSDEDEDEESKTPEVEESEDEEVDSEAGGTSDAAVTASGSGSGSDLDVEEGTDDGDGDGDVDDDVDDDDDNDDDDDDDDDVVDTPTRSNNVDSPRWARKDVDDSGLNNAPKTGLWITPGYTLAPLFRLKSRKPGEPIADTAVETVDKAAEEPDAAPAIEVPDVDEAVAVASVALGTEKLPGEQNYTSVEHLLMIHKNLANIEKTERRAEVLRKRLEWLKIKHRRIIKSSRRIVGLPESDNEGTHSVEGDLSDSYS